MPEKERSKTHHKFSSDMIHHWNCRMSLEWFKAKERLDTLHLCCFHVISNANDVQKSFHTFKPLETTFTITSRLPKPTYTQECESALQISFKVCFPVCPIHS
jgi:hypothetical protein